MVMEMAIQMHYLILMFVRIVKMIILLQVMIVDKMYMMIGPANLMNLIYTGQILMVIGWVMEKVKYSVMKM